MKKIIAGLLILLTIITPFLPFFTQQAKAGGDFPIPTIHWIDKSNNIQGIPMNTFDRLVRINYSELQNKFIITGYDPVHFRYFYVISTDNGQTWTKQDYFSEHQKAILSLARNHNLNISVAIRGKENSNKLYFSNNEINWEHYMFANATEILWINHLNSFILASNWAIVSLDSNLNVNSNVLLSNKITNIAWNPEFKYATAITENGNIYTSTDLINWHQRATGKINIRAIDWIGGVIKRLITIGSTYNANLIARYGDNWVNFNHSGMPNFIGNDIFFRNNIAIRVGPGRNLFVANVATATQPPLITPPVPDQPPIQHDPWNPQLDPIQPFDLFGWIPDITIPVLNITFGGSFLNNQLNNLLQFVRNNINSIRDHFITRFPIKWIITIHQRVINNTIDPPSQIQVFDISIPIPMFASSENPTGLVPLVSITESKTWGGGTIGQFYNSARIISTFVIHLMGVGIVLAFVKKLFSITQNQQG